MRRAASTISDDPDKLDQVDDDFKVLGALLTETGMRPEGKYLGGAYQELLP